MNAAQKQAAGFVSIQVSAEVSTAHAQSDKWSCFWLGHFGNTLNRSSENKKKKRRKSHLSDPGNVCVEGVRVCVYRCVFTEVNAVYVL